MPDSHDNAVQKNIRSAYETESSGTQASNALQRWREKNSQINEEINKEEANNEETNKQKRKDE